MTRVSSAGHARRLPPMRDRAGDGIAGPRMSVIRDGNGGHRRVGERPVAQLDAERERRVAKEGRGVGLVG